MGMLPSISTVCFTRRCPSTCVKKSTSSCAPPGHSVMWCRPLTRVLIDSSDCWPTLRGADSGGGRHLRSDEPGAFDHRLEFSKCHVAWQILHAAVRGDDETRRVHVWQGAADAPGDDLGSLDVVR